MGAWEEGEKYRPTIKDERYGFDEAIIQVTPYRSTDMYGKAVEVTEFRRDRKRGWYVRGHKVKANGSLAYATGNLQAPMPTVIKDRLVAMFKQAGW